MPLITLKIFSFAVEGERDLRGAERAEAAVIRKIFREFLLNERVAVS
jgi:hypothetical protein